MSLYHLKSGGIGLRLRIDRILLLDDAVEVLCRAGRWDEPDDMPARIPRARLATMLREEIWFGGVEAYGHFWHDNVATDDDGVAEMRAKARALLLAAWPQWEAP